MNVVWQFKYMEVKAFNNTLWIMWVVLSEFKKEGRFLMFGVDDK